MCREIMEKLNSVSGDLGLMVEDEVRGREYGGMNDFVEDAIRIAITGVNREGKPVRSLPFLGPGSSGFW